MAETRQLNFPRYAHVEGHTDVCYSEDGKYLITCGQDGDVRIWNGIEDSDPIEKCVGNQAYTIHQKGEFLYVGNDHHALEVHTFPEAELIDTLTRFTAPVCCLDSSKDGQLIAAGGCDSVIQVVNKNTRTVINFNGHKSPILSVKIDPASEFLASACCDGSVKVWSIETKNVIQEWSNVFLKSNAFHHSKIKCTPHWEPKEGNLLAIPFDKEIKFFQRGVWRELFVVHDYRLSNQEITVISWSKCGRYIAAGTNTGYIIVWNISSKIVVLHAECKERHSIRSLVWCPQKGTNTIAYCDDHGQLGLIENACSDDDILDENIKMASDDLDSDLLLDDEESGDNVISLEKIKNESGFGLLNDYKSDDNENSNLSSKYLPQIVAPIVNLQKSFQPCSTPIHLQRRFMIFNDVGYARQTNTEEENVIDVDFHDNTIHHAFRIKNVLNHTLAAMSKDALVLGCETQDDLPSKLVCILLNSWDGNREWSVDLPENEDIVGLAVTTEWIVVATSYRFLRLFTIAGGQREIVSIPGSIVAISGSENRLVVVHHCGSPIPEEQNLRYCVYKIDDQVEEVYTGFVPLTPKSTLRWIGFSDYGSLCILDSIGTLQILLKSYWTPLCYVDNSWKDSTNHYFIIGVSEARQDIRCILCKGSYYPSTTPHPFLNEIPWQIPLCDINQEKGEFEEKYWRSHIALEILPENDGQQYRKEFMTMFLKLFALACKSGHNMRALDLCKLIKSEQSLNLALKYAMRIGNSNLCEKITKIIENNSEIENLAPEPFNERLLKTQSYNTQTSSLQPNTNYNSQQSQDLFSDKYDSCNDNNVESSSILETIKKKKNHDLMNESSDIDRAINPFQKRSDDQANISAMTVSPLDSKNESIIHNKKRKSDLNDSSSADDTSIIKSKKPKGVSKLSSFVFKKN